MHVVPLSYRHVVDYIIYGIHVQDYQAVRVKDLQVGNELISRVIRCGMSVYCDSRLQ